MARVTYVKRAGWTKKERKCISCGHLIQEGEPYKHAEPRNRGQLLWCQNCSPKRSQLSSSKLGPLWDAIDELQLDGNQSLEDVKAVVESLVATAEEVRDDFQDGYDNMPEGLQAGSTGEESMMKIEAIDQLVNDLQALEDEGEDENEVRASMEKDVLIEMIEETGLDSNIYSDDALEDPIQRGDIINTLDIDFSAYENRVNQSVEEHMGEGVQGYAEKVTSAVESFEW